MIPCSPTTQVSLNPGATFMAIKGNIRITSGSPSHSHLGISAGAAPEYLETEDIRSLLGVVCCPLIACCQCSRPGRLQFPLGKYDELIEPFRIPLIEVLRAHRRQWRSYRFA